MINLKRLKILTFFLKHPIIRTYKTGESATLSEEEHKKVVKAAIEFTKHRVPVIAGTGSNSTQTAIELSQEADKDGADAVLIVTPYYNKATQKGLIAHYTSVANSIKVPVIMYNVPSRTGCGLNPETIAHLVKNVDNIVGLKDATGDLSHAAKTMNLCDGKLELYSGNDDQVVPLLSLGGLGVISVLSNIAPRQTHDIVMEFLEGDYKKAAKLQLDAIPLINALFCEVNPIPVKTAMNMLGWEAGPLRAPLLGRILQITLKSKIKTSDSQNSGMQLDKVPTLHITRSNTLFSFAAQKSPRSNAPAKVMTNPIPPRITVFPILPRITCVTGCRYL